MEQEIIYLGYIHYPERFDDTDENILITFKFWKEFIEENIIMPSYPGYIGSQRKEPSDAYLYELYENIDFEGYINPKDYPFLTHINGNPYIPSWHVLKWAKKAIRKLESKLGEKNIL